MAKKSNSYWEGRQKQWFANQDKMDADVSKRIHTEYQRTAKELEKDIASYFQRYSQDDVIEFRTMMQGLSKVERDLLFQNMEDFALIYPEHAHLLPVRESIYELNRLQGLHYSTQMKLLELGAIEQKELEKHLERTYGKRYAEMLGELGIGQNFLAIDNELMKDTIFAKWVNGENFSDRVWENKEKMLNHLQTRYRDGLARGDNYARLTKGVMERFDVGYNDARRLVWTEATFVLNQSHTHAYLNAGVEEYEISAIMDKKTSKICQDMDGEVFRFDELAVGLNFPPFHPYCRTTFIGIMPEREIDDIVEGNPEVKQEITDKHDGIFNQFNDADTYRQEFDEILSNMDADDLVLYNQLTEFAKDNNFAYRGGAHYHPGTKKINMNLESNPWEKAVGSSRKGAFSTKLHEEFHQLDDLLARTKFATDGSGNSYGFIKLTSIETETGTKMYEAIQDDVLNLVNRSIDWGNKKHGTEYRNLKSLNRISREARIFTKDYLDEHYSDAKGKAQISMFTDAMGGATNGRLSPHNFRYWGHSNQYYKDRGKGVAASEAWAEFGAYKFTYDDETKNVIENLMPETLKANEGIYKEIVEYVKDNPLEYIKK